MRTPPVLLLVTGLCAVAVATACGQGSPASTTAAEPGAPGADALSIVQLGDSVASGEGTLYGYTYDADKGVWTGGNVDAPWPPPYPDCHDSPDAYGNLVAGALGATFTQFACTGATFASGIASAETDDGSQLRPAQFGNWANRTELNAAYDEADPDVVLVTLGADDLQFVAIVEACIKNGYEYYFDLADLECVASNPGATIQTDYVDAIPQLQADYATLAGWIADRAVADDRPVPRVVFTNYPNPLPADGTKCADMNWLYPEQVTYLSGLIDQLNATIASTVGGLPGGHVQLADISGAYAPQGMSHIWCTDDPWAYGLSIYKVTQPSSFESQAPFHPTPAGQESIAAHVVPAVRTAVGR